MGIHIVTGYAGKEHVTSADAGSMNAGIVGTGRYVMQTAEQFAAEIVSNNLIKVKSGDLMNQGRHIRIGINDYEEVTIQNGAQSVYRNDLIVMRYKKDTSTLIETAEIVVIKGTAGATATDPTYTSGDILAGATQDDFPLYRVSINGLNIEKVTPLFSTVPNLDELNTKIDDETKQRVYPIADGVGATRTGSDVHLRINQTSSYLKTTLKNLYALTLKEGYRPAARVSDLCLLWNNASGDQKFYLGCFNINPDGKISCNRQEWGGGVTAISDGGTYYVWSLNMEYRTSDPMPTD